MNPKAAVSIEKPGGSRRIHESCCRGPTGEPRALSEDWWTLRPQFQSRNLAVRRESMDLVTEFLLVNSGGCPGIHEPSGRGTNRGTCRFAEDPRTPFPGFHW